LPSSLALAEGYGDHRDLHSFPTRRLFRSSKNALTASPSCSRPSCRWTTGAKSSPILSSLMRSAIGSSTQHSRCASPARAIAASRSEEHTSELQSRENLVCRLLLEKKNNNH